MQRVVERVLLGQDPDGSCANDITEQFLETNLTGTRKGCEEVLRGLRSDGATVTFQRSVGVDGVTGVDKVVASANVTFSTERGKPGKSLVYDLIWDESRWRIDSAFDRSAVAADSASGSGSS